MSDMKEAAIYLHEMEVAEQKTAQEKADRERMLKEEAESRYDHLKNDRRKVQEAFLEYKKMVKDVCLQYAIEGMMETAIAKTALETKDQNMLHGLVNNYIQEAGGATNILMRASGKTYLLDTIKEEVEEVTDTIIAKADPQDPNTFVVDKKDVKQMMDKLNKNDDYEEVKSAIAVRVVGAEDSFVTNAQAEKEKINDIMLKAEDKCKAADADTEMSDEVKDEIKQEATREMKRELTRINETPKKAIFDEMVRLFSTSSLKNQRPGFIQENGHIDQERVYNTVKTMYTLVETLSTSKLERVDEAFIASVMEDMKK